MAIPNKPVGELKAVKDPAVEEREVELHLGPQPSESGQLVRDGELAAGCGITGLAHRAGLRAEKRSQDQCGCNGNTPRCHSGCASRESEIDPSTSLRTGNQNSISPTWIVCFFVRRRRMMALCCSSARP